MSRDQRRLVWEWFAAAGVVVAVVAAGHYLSPKQLAWARWLILPLVLVVRVAIPYGETERRGRATINEIASENAWLKWWATLWAAVCFGAAIFLSRSSYRVPEEDIVALLFLALAVILGPLVYLIEREKFRNLGD